MSRAKTILKLIKLKSNLDTILTNLEENEHKELLYMTSKDKRAINDIENDEYKFIYKWEQENLNKTTFNFRDKNTSVIIANAILESTKKIKRNKQTRQFLPKAERINTENIKVIFFEHNKNTYALINTSNENHYNRVEKLIGERNIDELGEEYNLNENLFSWLVYIYKECNEQLSDNWKIKNITGFTGNAVDEDNIFKGTSDYTTDLVITKAFMSNGESLTDVTVQVATSEAEADFIFSVDNQANTNLFTNRTVLYFDSDQSENSKIVYLYTVLIPKLKLLYEESKENFLSDEKSAFLKKMGFDVIDSIIEKNDISMDVIKYLIKKKNIPLDTIEKMFDREVHPVVTLQLKN